uniref:NADH-ubiquinone oxidoreductase chain 4 n=1 Tax=Crypsis chinensis TaxID=2984370 RepID=A0A978D8V8_9CUCU|nr:NADH dehydrogenase subunit 4 [Crypsis chinensis]UYB79090.1 NADH dehydrogenase subunit 4 [Crypsis chinensis]
MMSLLFSMLVLTLMSFFNYWFIYLLWGLMGVFLLMTFSIDNNWSMVSYGMGLDMLSFVMVLLTFWIIIMMIMASSSVYLCSKWSSHFLFVIGMLMISLFMTFVSMNLFIFYLFFEFSLVPTLILIVGWGYQPERLQAGLYLLFYTLLASLPMMMALSFCYSEFGSLNFYFFEPLDSLIYFFLINLVFLVKVPMFMFHLWLPKAHVEAPISGSMILAGVMLKLGGYGMMRCFSMFISAGLFVSGVFISVGLVGGVMVSFMCLRQSDMKSLIAYSSVSHMGLMMVGLFTFNYWGMVGSLVLMVGHGLCSSGLFCAANILYERTHSRSLYLNKGMINLIPGGSLLWFMLVSSNMAAPPSLNLLGEIILINSVVSFSSLTCFFLMLSSFMSAAYSLFLYSYSQHGKILSGLFSYFVFNVREYLLLFLHWVPLNIMFLYGDVVGLWI